MTNGKNNTAAAGFAGMVIGAGLTAVTVALINKKTRQKVVDSFKDAKKYADGMVHNAAEKTNEVRHAIDEHKESIDEAKDDISQDVKKL